MSQQHTACEFREVGLDELELIRPLWEKLKAFHLPLSPLLAARRSERTFDMRREQFVAKGTSGKLRVELVYTGTAEAPVAFCVSSLAPDGTGEIDALYVEENHRGAGVGTTLVRRALAWLDELNVATKVVLVADGNNKALEFYRQFGFVTDNLTLRQVADMDCQPKTS